MNIPAASQRYIQQIVNLAPELNDRPFYVLAYNAAELRLPGADDGTLAWAFIGLDHPEIEEVLRSRGEWRGNGRAILLNLAAIRRITTDESFSARLHSIVIHELAHHLPKQDVIDWPRIEDPADREKMFAAVNRKRKREHEQAIAAVEPWHSHGLSFIRVCVHLAWRAERTEIPLSLPTIAAGPDYGLTGFYEYTLAFGDEPERLADQSFGFITSLPFPPWAEDIFGRDVERWQAWNEHIQKWKETA